MLVRNFKEVNNLGEKLNRTKLVICCTMFSSVRKQASNEILSNKLFNYFTIREFATEQKIGKIRLKNGYKNNPEGDEKQTIDARSYIKKGVGNHPILMEIKTDDATKKITNMTLQGNFSHKEEIKDVITNEKIKGEYISNIDINGKKGSHFFHANTSIKFKELESIKFTEFNDGQEYMGKNEVVEKISEILINDAIKDEDIDNDE